MEITWYLISSNKKGNSKGKQTKTQKTQIIVKTYQWKFWGEKKESYFKKIQYIEWISGLDLVSEHQEKEKNPKESKEVYR